MKIEKINDNSIRCTLTSFDLSVRNMNIRELAYGTEKAKKLFDEMMHRANDEVGFSVENSPIMIEAIPMNGDSIQLIISKVDDPEELDARFSRFSKNPAAGNPDTSWISKLTSELLEGAGSIFGQLQKLSMPKSAQPQQPADASASSHADTPESLPAPEEKVSSAPSDKTAKVQPKISKEPPAPSVSESRAFIFNSLSDAINACKAASAFNGESTLYKKPDGSHFVLVIENKNVPQDLFSKTCNLLAEYGRMLKVVSASVSYYEEHYTVISGDHALNKLSGI